MKIDQRWERREEISNNNGNLMVSSLDQTDALGSGRYKYCIHSTVLYKNYCNIRYAYINEKKDERKKKTRCGSSSSKMKQVVFIIISLLYHYYIYLFFWYLVFPPAYMHIFCHHPILLQWTCN
jgi:hypothetical protein